MKKIKYFLLILLVFYTKSEAQETQIKEGAYIQYKAYLNKTEDPQMYSDLIPNLNEKLIEVNFDMIISNGESVFALVDADKLSKEDINSVLDICDMLGNRCYKSKDSDFSMVEKSDFLIKFPTRINWKITDEKKTIQGYKCRKAIAVLEKLNEDNQYYEAYPLVAWFADDIVLPFGPNGIGNLPGQILELEQRIITFVAVKIERGNFILPKKDTKEELTIKEYYRRIYD